MTQEQLDALCRDWQRILRLQDWDIEIQIRRREKMSSSDCSGDVECFMDRRLARISFLDPLDYYEEHAGRYDPEQILVHELLHIYWWPVTHDLAKERECAEEQAINAISTALVNLKRAQQQPVGAPHGNGAFVWEPFTTVPDPAKAKVEP